MKAKITLLYIASVIGFEFYPVINVTPPSIILGGLLLILVCAILMFNYKYKILTLIPLVLIIYHCVIVLSIIKAMYGGYFMPVVFEDNPKMYLIIPKLSYQTLIWIATTYLVCVNLFVEEFRNNENFNVSNYYMFITKYIRFCRRKGSVGLGG